MRIIVFALAALLTLAACAGGRTFSNDLQMLEGKPINDAFLMLGEPTGDYHKNDTLVYVWQRRKSESVFGPSVTAGHGYQLGRHSTVLGSDFLWSGVEYYNCVIRAYTHKGVIQDITQEGNPRGCETIYRYRKHPTGLSPHSL